MKLFIDTDPGIDDAIALLMAFAAPHVEVVGTSGVAGNVGLDDVMRNLAVVLDVAGAPRDLPLWRGSACALLGCARDAAGFHGEGGLGGAAFPLSTRAPAPGHAALAISRAAREHPGELCLLALGPLTNVALAFALDPELPSLLQRLVVMGGTIRGCGNITPAAEFNAWADPEAFARVLAADAPLVLVSWETTLDHMVPWETWGRWVTGEGALAGFVASVTRLLVEREKGRGWPGMALPDPLAAAVAIAPECVLAAEDRHVVIELAGGETRGQTIVDARVGCTPAANARIVQRIDMAIVERLVRAGLREVPGIG